MTLTSSLLIIFLLFCLTMAGVLAFCLHERRHSRHGPGDATIDHSNGHSDSAAATRLPQISLHSAAPNPADEASDQRVALIVFGSIFVGVVLAIIAGYLVFFREWTA